MAFATAAAAACALVTLPVTALSTAFAPVEAGALWPTVLADAVEVVRLCAPAGLLIVLTAGVPWSAPGDADRPVAGIPSVSKEL